MALKLRQDAAFDMLTLTSMGVRIAPLNRQPVHMGGLFSLQATSAESNVLNVPASLGMKVKVLSKFVKGSPVARFIQDDLRRRNMSCEGPEVEQGGPWGYRHQFNIADAGFGARAPRVWNDRAGEVGRTLGEGDFDFDRIFSKEGCRILHLSGLVAALSPETIKCCLAAARACKSGGGLVSFDLNHRATFWKNRESELREAFSQIAGMADVLIGNEEDFQLALGIKGPEAGGESLSDKIGSFKDMISRVREAYPNAAVYANTLREVISANAHMWGAMLWTDGKWHVETPREIPVLDRIGGGDSFVSGLMYGILKGWEPEKWLQFGWASGALTVTLEGDYAMPADEKQIWDIYKGNARVQR
jgi:2-dehydro-3-deoxygluconokinase